MCMGDHLVKSWSSTQACVALSSGEAEFNAAVKATSIGLGFQSLLEDLGVHDVSIECYLDSSTAIGIASRSGLGKVRHLAVHLLWLQDAVKNKQVQLVKIAGSKNPADMLTKHLTREVLDRHAYKAGIMLKEGRSVIAPRMLSSDTNATI